MRYLSVCAGIEAASVAWRPLGWTAVAFAEIDRFPSAVLKHHYQEVPNVGDFTAIRGDEYGAIDLLVAGTPCQDFSVAGLRAGMDGARGQLTVEFARLAGRLRPRWLVWENVPGVLSIDGGRAFGTFLGILGQLGYGLAYRVLDAQFFGVPQRRRRVFVVGHLGDWRRAAAVLFERHSLSGHPAPSRKAGQGTSYDVAPCIGASGRGFERTGDTRGQDCVVPHCMSTDQAGAKIGIGIGTTLNCNHEAPIVAAFTETAGTLYAAYGTKWNGNGAAESGALFAGVTHSLRADGFDASEDGTGRGTPLVPISVRTAQTSVNGHGVAEDVAHMLDGANGQAVCFGINGGDTGFALRSNPLHSGDKGDGGLNTTLVAFQSKASATQSINPTSISPALDVGKCDGVAVAFAAEPGMNQQPYLRSGMAVRRLTPRECERLQGFPTAVEIVEDKLSRDEIVALLLASGDIFTIPEEGRVFRMRGPGGVVLSPPAECEGTIVNGYRTAHLSARGVKKQIRINRLIWISVHGIPPSGMVVDHINSVKTDDRITNLQLLSQLANSRKAADDGLYRTSPTQKLDVELRMKLFHDYAASKGSYSELAAKYGITKGRVGQIVREYDYTKISDKTADGPRYKALGNSMAVPVMRWIGERIQAVEAI